MGTPLLTIGAMLRYEDTPVGRHAEVMAVTLIRGRRGPITHCPFIAVDSPASVVGGRANWALAKTLARFEGTPAERAMRLARVDVEALGSEAVRAFVPNGRFWGVVGEPMKGWLGTSEPYHAIPQSITKPS